MVRRSVAHQVHRDAAEIVPAAPAPRRDARQHRGAEPFVAEGARRHLGLDPAGQDRIDADAVACQLDRQRPHVRGQAALGGAVVAVARRALDCRRARGRHQTPARAVLDHVARSGAKGEEGALQVDAQHAAELLQRHVEQRRGSRRDAGVGETGVDLAQRLDRGGKGLARPAPRPSRRRRRLRPAPASAASSDLAFAVFSALEPQIATRAPAASSALAMP